MWSIIIRSLHRMIFLKIFPKSNSDFCQYEPANFTGLGKIEIGQETINYLSGLADGNGGELRLIFLKWQ